MKRFLLIALIVGTPVAYAGELEDRYSEGLTAARESRWNDVIASMEGAIAIDPDPKATIVIRRERVPYIPYFWLGKAWLAREDYARALEYFRRSGSGIIDRTTYFTDYRTSRSIAEARLTASPEAEFEAVRTRAAEARQGALEAQTAAIRAGAARSEDFVSASRSLQEAVDQERLGTVEGYRGSIEAAQKAEELFRLAIDASSRTRRTRVVRPQQPDPEIPAEEETPPPEPVETTDEIVDQPVEEEASDETEPVAAESAPALPNQAVPPPEPVESAPPVSAVPAADAALPELTDMLEAAYRMIARGDYEASARALSRVIEENPREPEAFLLRGYARFVSSVLQENTSLESEAREDFAAALRLDDSLYLDERWFSPKAAQLLDSLRN